MRSFMICILSKYYFCDQIKEGEPGQTCGTNKRENRKCFYWKPGGRRPLERHKLRWEDDTVTDLKETGWESMWTGKI